jgi:PAS domain-containing protein
MDRNHTIVDLNDAAAHCGGRPRRECIGLKFWDLFDNQGCRDGTCAAAMAVSTGRTCFGEARPKVVHTGHHVPVRVTAAPRRDAHGKIVGVVEVVYPVEHEIRFSDALKLLAEAAHEGNLAERAPADQFEGRYRDACVRDHIDR